MKKCANCGREMPAGAGFCLACGSVQDPRPAPALPRPEKRLLWILIPAVLLAAALVCVFIASGAANGKTGRGPGGDILPATDGSTSPPPETAAPVPQTDGPESGTTEREPETPPVSETSVEPVPVTTVPPVSTAAPLTGGPSSAAATDHTGPATTASPETTASPPGTTASSPVTTPPGTTVSPPGTTEREPDTVEPEPDTAAPPDTPPSPETTAAPPVTTASPPDTTVFPPETTTSAPETTASPPEIDAPGGAIGYGDMTVYLLNDLESETGNYFFYYGGSFQTFRIISCQMYTSGGTLRIRGSATAVTPAETSDDAVGVQIFYEGQNQYTEPVIETVVSIIPQGVNEGITVTYDCAVADWKSLADSGKKVFVMFLSVL